MIGRARESRNPKKVIRVTLMESYGEIGRVPVNLSSIEFAKLIIRYPFPNMYFDIFDIKKVVIKCRQKNLPANAYGQYHPTTFKKQSHYIREH